MKRRAVWFEAPGVATLRDEAAPLMGDDGALVRTIVSAVSAGTERLVLLGAVPEEARAAMAMPSMRGSFALPISYGYACVGEVIEAGATSAWKRGDRLFAFHPHHDVIVARAGDARPLPAHLPPTRCSLAANLETAINVVWDAEIALGDRVVVAGLGVVGWLVALLAKRAGASEVVAVEPDEARRAIAPAGVRTTASIDAAFDADVFVEASGSPRALEAIVARAGHEARVVVASWYGEGGVTLPLGATFHPNRVRIQSSQVASITPSKRGRWDADRRWKLACALLDDAALDAIVAPPIPLADAPVFYASLARGARPCPPHVVFDHR